MENAFDQFDSQEETGNAFDQFDLSEPKDQTVNVLPSFLQLDTPQAKHQRDELIRKDPAAFINIAKDAPVEGVKRGLMDIGEGFKQLALEAGEFIGARERGSTLEGFTKPAEEERKNYEETYGLFPGAKITRFIGQNAPYAYLPMKAPSQLFVKASSIPYVGKVAASPLFQKTAVGTAFGGAVAGTQFAKEGESRGENVLVGAGIGAGIPLVGKTLTKLAQWSDNVMVQPFTKNGAYKDIAKFLRKEISENRDKIEKAVKSSIAKGENKTVAQIIAETTQGSGDDFGGMLVKLEKDLSKESDALKSIYAIQSKSHVNALDRIAGSEDDLLSAMSTRKIKADNLYKQSYAVNITTDSNLKKIVNNKYAKKALKDASAIAEVDGITPKKNLTQYLHYVKEGLDKQLNATDSMGKTALGREELRAVGEVKKKLIKWIGEKNPTYDKARLQYQVDSIPINKMELGQELKKAYIGALGENKPGVFAKSVQDAHKTIKRATGFGNKSKGLNDILDTSDVDAINKIKSELTSDTQRKTMAAASKSVLNELSGEVSISLPHILSRPIVVTNHLLKMLGHDKTPAYKKLLVNIVKDPAEFLRAYKLPESDPRGEMASDIISKLTTITATTSTVSE